ncbi:MAG: hypothetical protein V4512_06700 [Pseudomonadota bacterium]
MSSRPNGSGQYLGGWLFLGIAVILFVMGVDETSSSYEANALIVRLSYFTLSGCAVGIAFMLFVTAWIIRAISFLPGKRETYYRPTTTVEDAASSDSLGFMTEHDDIDAYQKSRPNWPLLMIVAIAAVLIASAIYGDWTPAPAENVHIEYDTDNGGSSKN